MRINRRFLYAGVFLVALGAILVAADVGALDLGVVRDALRLWPVVIVLIGVALVVRRSPAALPVGLLAAGAPGLVLGGAIAIGPRFIADCATPGGVRPATAQAGTLEGPRSLAIHARCGSVTLRTDAAATGWTLAVAERTGPPPQVSAGDGSLAVDAVGAFGAGGWTDWRSFTSGREAVALTVPTGDLGAISAVVSGTDTTIDLANARVAGLDVTATASRLRVDLSASSISTISARMSFGQLTLIVPAGSDLTGDLNVSATDLRICSAIGNLQPTGLRITGRGFADGVVVDGRHVDDRGLTYESPNYATAIRHADLRVNASFGSIEINPNGGCS